MTSHISSRTITSKYQSVGSTGLSFVYSTISHYWDTKFTHQYYIRRKLQVEMWYVCIGTKALQVWWLQGCFTKISWQYEPCYILSCNRTRLHGAGRILECVYIIQMLTIQNEWCKQFRSFIMRIGSPVYSVCLQPCTNNISRK